MRKIGGGRRERRPFAQGRPGDTLFRGSCSTRNKSTMDGRGGWWMLLWVLRRSAPPDNAAFRGRPMTHPVKMNYYLLQPWCLHGDVQVPVYRNKMPHAVSHLMYCIHKHSIMLGSLQIGVCTEIATHRTLGEAQQNSTLSASVIMINPRCRAISQQTE